MSGGVRGAPRARYLPIAEHGLIGDLHTVALVGTDGTIDWYCCPRFDSPSVFAAILDADRGGLFRIAPDCDGWSSKQLYLPDTNVLITRFLMPDGVGEVQDFMPPPRTGEAAHRHRIIRRVLAVRGQMRFVVDVAPRFDYARARHEVALTQHGALFRSPELELSLSTRCPLEIVDGGDVRARIAAPGRGDGHLRARPRRARRDCRCRTPMPTSPPSSTPPWRSGGAGCAARATAGAGARWCIARRSRSSCSPTRPPARSWPPPPPACRSSSAAHATGTTATRGCATPPSRSTRCSGSGSPRRPARSWTGWRGASATRPTASRARCRSCTASTGARTCPRRSSRTWRATWARRRCGSATGRRPSCSSTSTAS